MPVLCKIYLLYISYNMREFIRRVKELLLQERNYKIQMELSRTSDHRTCHFRVLLIKLCHSSAVMCICS